MHKKLRAGFVGKDAMRDKADKLMKNCGKTKDVCHSSSSADKEKKRLYKQGGKVESAANPRKQRRNCQGK